MGVLGPGQFYHYLLHHLPARHDGVCIAGTAQGPKNLSESIASSLAAVAKTGALLKKGFLDLEPLVAKIDTDKCVCTGFRYIPPVQ